MSADNDALTEIYQRETMELMGEYDRLLMEASGGKRLDSDAINGLFRIVHTIKSTSAMIGLNTVSACTHRMEDYLLLFRNQPEKAAGNPGRMIDLLYGYADYINGETSRLTEAGYSAQKPDALLAQINAELNFFAQEAQPEAPAREPSTSEHAEKDAVTLCVRFRENCAMENVRAFQLMKQIKPLCVSLSSLPDDLEAKSAAARIRSDGLLLTLVTEFPDKLAKKLRASPYVESFDDMDSGADEPKPETEPTAPGQKTEQLAVKMSKFGMVAWDKILMMQNVTGELITAYTLLRGALEQSPVFKDVEGYLVTNRKLLSDLETLVTEASMMPISSVASQYHRLIRDISRNESKQVEFHLSGEELELDRNLLDAISNPLIHLIRNAVDHGIEAPERRLALGKPPVGNVTLKVESLGGTVRFTVSDDGGGIDTGKVLAKAKERGLLTKPEEAYTETEIRSFIFAPGFTTNRTVNAYSGRGVGMDVVQKTVESLGGVVRVNSAPDQGSSFILEVPVSMSSVECICFAVGRYDCLLPIRTIDTVLSYGEAEGAIQSIDGRQRLQWNERLIPVINLYQVFSQPESAVKQLMVIRGMERSVALLTGEVKGEQTAVEKSLPPMLGAEYRSRYGVSGCSVISSGKLGLVLSAELFIKMSSGKAW